MAMSTWNDVAVAFWQQVYVECEQQYEVWRWSSMGERCVWKTRPVWQMFSYTRKLWCCGRFSAYKATCDHAPICCLVGRIRDEIGCCRRGWCARRTSESHVYIDLCWQARVITGQPVHDWVGCGLQRESGLRDSVASRACKMPIWS